MIDFWMAFVPTMMVTILTILADWLASRFIIKTRTLHLLLQILEAGLSSSDTEKKLRKELYEYRSSISNSLAWGSDLAIVAISMDFAALGIWIRNPHMFPFFSRFNDLNISLEIPVWLFVIFLHSIFLIISLSLKHFQAKDIEGSAQNTFATLSKKDWFYQNGCIIAANSTGFISLLTSIIFFTNAL